MRRKIWGLHWLFGVLSVAAIALLPSCRSKMDGGDLSKAKVHDAAPAVEPNPAPDGGREPPNAPEPAPVVDPQPTEPEIVDGFAAQRVRFQTRNAITLDMKPVFADGGSVFSMVNEDQKKSLLELQPINLPLDRAGLLFDPTKATVTLYLGAESTRQVLQYGQNTLRLSVDNDPPRWSLAKFELKDFPLFGLYTTSNGTKREIGSGFEGSYSVTGGRIRAVDGSSLSLGFIPILSH